MSSNTTFFPGHLTAAAGRLSTSEKVYTHRLDKNEQAEDVPGWMKLQVLQKAMEMEWNRYPDLNHSDVEQQIASGIGISREQVVLGSGSATFITTLLNFFGMQRRQIVIAEPSYSLFNYHCKTYGIAYTPWMLNEQLEYDERLLPTLEEGSIVFIVSPNNPVGNTISIEMLGRILAGNPGALVVLDAVYAEFGGDDCNGLLKEFNNLLILRSMSKEMPVAGLRLGYMCGNVSVVSVIRKLMLPFTINPMFLAFAGYMMFDRDFMETAFQSRIQLIAERERMQADLCYLLPLGAAIVYPTAGNFLLIKIPNNHLFSALMQAFEAAGIRVLNTSGMPLLRNTFRVSIGSYKANSAVVELMLQVLNAEEVYV
jgi:histidinol-phosphate aminotransferase